MTKLKTLEDIEYQDSSDDYGPLWEDMGETKPFMVSKSKELKAEAIKHIKAMEGGKQIVVIPGEDGKPKHWVANDCLDRYTIDWIKYFFRIKKEELE